MILAIGIDSIEIGRFTTWHCKPIRSLQRIFSSDQEIAYCLQVPIKSAERFAARFAVREALYKALGPLLCTKLPFFTLCKYVSIVANHGRAPTLILDWQSLTPYLRAPKVPLVHISITHTQTIATVLVIIETRAQRQKL
jgi:phosphopantetheine--protein transferase-like protein